MFSMIFSAVTKNRECHAMKDNRVYAFNERGFIHEGCNGEHTGQWSVANLVLD